MISRRIFHFLNNFHTLSTIVRIYVKKGTKYTLSSALNVAFKQVLACMRVRGFWMETLNRLNKKPCMAVLGDA